jgi:hypothetical protein
MARKHFLEELNQEVKADRTHAQILIKITPSSKALEEAKRIIEDSGVHIIETKHLSTNHWILLRLDVKDMRDAALKLTEHGFVIKGINALPEE